VCIVGGVPFLAGCVPDLGLDALVLDDQGAGLELDADGSFGVQAELVAREPGQYLRLPDRRIPYQHHLEHVVYFLVRVARHFLQTESAEFRDRNRRAQCACAWENLRLRLSI